MLIALLAFAAFPVRAEMPRLVSIDFELIDTNLEGEMQGARADEQQRLAMLSEQLPQLLIDKGGYAIVDRSPNSTRVSVGGCP